MVKYKIDVGIDWNKSEFKLYKLDILCMLIIIC